MIKPRKRKLLEQRQEVIRRWFSLKMISKAPALSRRLMRPWLRRTEKKRRLVLEETFKAVKDQAIKFEHSRYESAALIFNIALYFLLTERDIQTVKVDALTHPNEWTRKLCARVILLAIHEWDMDKVSGTRLRDAFRVIGAPDDLRLEATEALRLVRSVQTRARKEFGPLRNATIAHRDPNALAQYRAIRDLSVERVMALTTEFYLGAERFIAVVPRLMIQSSTAPALVQQILNQRSDRT